MLWKFSHSQATSAPWTCTHGHTSWAIRAMLILNAWKQSYHEFINTNDEHILYGTGKLMQLTFDGGGSLGRGCLALWICDDCCRLLRGWSIVWWPISSTFRAFWLRLPRPIYENSKQNLCTSLVIQEDCSPPIIQNNWHSFQSRTVHRLHSEHIYVPSTPCQSISKVSTTIQS